MRTPGSRSGLPAEGSIPKSLRGGTPVGFYVSGPGHREGWWFLEGLCSAVCRRPDRDFEKVSRK